MNTESPITMTLHYGQCCFPTVWDATGSPVAYDVGFDMEDFCEGANATGGLNGLVEYGHGVDYITLVSAATHKSDVNIKKMKTLAQRLAFARTRKGDLWTQKHLAVASGVSLATIGMMESGQRGNKGKIPGSVNPIAKALGVNYDWLAYGTGDMLAAEPEPFVAYDADLSALQTVYRAIPPASRVSALAAATQAMIAFLTPHTSAEHDQDALEAKQSEVRPSSPAKRKTT